ncbi:MAG TPA: ABC transporter permease [Terrisporobacter glycolicus]|uniref:ABC transporter permease n=1 Tax=Terrisporobacter TaxID=1505652 RepID=UPI000E8BCECC|nr:MULTISPECIES: FtsX-like permease family protein [Terrisporobacter]MBN9648587.1 FtsX-like permease family protein [Terrisporobacter glycolicus]HBI94259.1 ABC transporter permease [Terrisporobacter hibernicus]
MKIENNNKNIIKKITKSSLKSNKTRNIFVVVAIILTTFMISSVFTLGMSFAKNYATMNLRDQGTTASTFLPNPTDKQIKEIMNLDVAKNIGKEINAGIVSSKELSKSKTTISLKYLDETNWEKQLSPCISDIEGDYPTKENEIMISKISLKFLDKENAKIGDKIKIPCDINGKVSEKEFVISGYFASYAYIQDSGEIFVSEDFIKDNNLTLEKNGQLLITLEKSKKNQAPKLLEKEVSLNKKQKLEYNYDVEQDSEGIMMASVSIVAIIGGFIVFSGYLLIYNILYIAVTRNIQFYGLLKTIGTSPKQIKKIVRGQGLRLAAIGIPIGLTLSVIVSYLIVPSAIEGMSGGTYYASMMPSEIYFTPLVFVGTILFALITILISCKKPAKIASSISPIEAMKFSGKKSKKEKKNRNSTKGGKLYKMAWHNVFRDKKRAILVFLSLFMGIMTYLSVNTFMNSISLENYANRYLPNDFEIQNYYDDNFTLDNKVIDKIKTTKGVDSVEVLATSSIQMDMNEKVLMPALQRGYRIQGEDLDGLDKYLKDIEKDPSKLAPMVVGLEDQTIERYNEAINKKIDIEAFKKGNLALIDGFYYNDKEKLNFSKEKITFRNAKENKSKKIKIDLMEEENSILSIGSSETGMPVIYVSSSTLNKLTKDTNNHLVYVDVKDSYDSEVKSKLKTLASKNRFNLTSKTDTMNDFKKSSMMMNLLGGGIAIILIIIGLLNFINVMVTNVNVRLKELAIMESIGMTKRQVITMLTLEGAYYAGITTLITCTLGMGVVYFIAQLTKQIADYAEFVFPTIPLLSLITLIFAVCLIIPSIVYKYDSKSSVTERLREIEN